MKIGFLGLGIMGSRMALNLCKAGHELIVANRTRNKADALLSAGAEWAQSPSELAEQVEILVTVLSTPGAVQETALGKDGFLDHLKEGALWVDCSTVNPSFSRQMAAEALTRNVRFLDAPVAGSKVPAEQGQLLFLVGGEASEVEVCQPLFDVMGKKTIHAGGHGMGCSLKMIINLLLGEAMAAFSEAMVLGQSLGFSREMLLDLLPGLPVVAPFVAGKREKIEGGEYEADFPLQWMQKDLQLAAQTAYEQGVSLPAVNVIKEVYALAMQAGFAEKDFSAIYKFLLKD